MATNYNLNKESFAMKNYARHIGSDFSKVIGFMAAVTLLPCGIAFASAPCQGPAATLDCLKNNFDALYVSDYKTFWKIIDSEMRQAKEARETRKMAEFLEIYEVASRRNAEFEEFFSETIETLCVNNTEYFLDILLEVSPEVRAQVFAMLNPPLFKSHKEIQDSFLKLRDNKKYKSIADSYLALSNSPPQKSKGFMQKISVFLQIKCSALVKYVEGFIGE